jgi:hypothetical protein
LNYKRFLKECKLLRVLLAAHVAVLVAVLVEAVFMVILQEHPVFYLEKTQGAIYYIHLPK